MAHRGHWIEVWTTEDLRLDFDRRYTMLLQPGTVFDVERDGHEIIGLRINGVWVFRG